jgi:hypothetical protein
MMFFKKHTRINSRFKKLSNQYSVYAFGEFIHYIDKKSDFQSKRFTNLFENFDIIIKKQSTLDIWILNQ